MATRKRYEDSSARRRMNFIKSYCINQAAQDFKNQKEVEEKKEKDEIVKKRKNFNEYIISFIEQGLGVDEIRKKLKDINLERFEELSSRKIKLLNGTDTDALTAQITAQIERKNRQIEEEKKKERAKRDKIGEGR